MLDKPFCRYPITKKKDLFTQRDRQVCKTCIGILKKLNIGISAVFLRIDRGGGIDRGEYLLIRQAQFPHLSCGK